MAPYTRYSAELYISIVYMIHNMMYLRHVKKSTEIESDRIKLFPFSIVRIKRKII
jgi:hypothetical protein